MNNVTIQSLSERINYIIKTKFHFARNVKMYLQYMEDNDYISGYELKQDRERFHVIIRLFHNKPRSITFVTGKKQDTTRKPNTKRS